MDIWIECIEIRLERITYICLIGIPKGAQSLHATGSVAFFFLVLLTGKKERRKEWKAQLCKFPTLRCPQQLIMDNITSGILFSVKIYRKVLALHIYRVLFTIHVYRF